jgi:hypothetical protein
MKRILCAIFLVIALSLRAEPSSESASAGTWQLQYATAFESLSKADKSTKILLENYDTVPIDSKTEAALKQFATAIKVARDATGADIHQATPRLQDIQPLIDQLGPARALFSLMMLQARADEANGDERAAAHDLIATIALGRNISKEPVIISGLVGIMVEEHATKALAKKLTTMPLDARGELRKEYESLPEPIKFSEIIRGEQGLAPQLLARQMGAAAPGEIKKLSPLYDAAAKAADESPDKFSQLVQDAAKATGSDLAVVTAPAFNGPFQTYRRLQIERALFLAAFDVCDNGAQSIQKTSDPAGEGPFKFEATQSGFKLSSALTDKEGKPVTLIVGQ